MSDTIGSLVIDLVANTANFSNQLTVARKSVEDFAGSVKSIFGSLGAVFSIAGIAELTKDTLNFGDELQKASIKTGLGATAISELAFAARQVNVDLPELTSSIDKMEKSISQAATGTGTSKEAFDALGISVAQLKALAPEQQFEVIANQIAKLKDPTDKARAAIDIFGKSGADMLPLFEQGAAGIELARQKAVDFGASLDADQIKKMADASTAVKDLGESFKDLATVLIAKASPALKGFFDSITSTVTGNEGDFLQRRLTTLQTLFDALIPGSPAATGFVGKELQGLILQTQTQLQGLQLAKQIKDGLASGNALPSTPAPGFQAEIKPITFGPLAFKIPLDGMKDFWEKIDDETETGAEKLRATISQKEVQVAQLLKNGQFYLDPSTVSDATLRAQDLNRVVIAGNISVAESFNRLNNDDDVKSLGDLMTMNASDIGTAYKQMQDDLTASFTGASNASKLAGDNMKADWDKLVSNAKQTANGIEDSFATFLVDPFDGGLKKMLSSWTSLLAQMIAKAEAASVFKALFPDSGGLAGLLQGFLGGGFTPTFDASPGAASSYLDGLAGHATGGSWKVGGSGGSDSQLVAFKASPDETVSVMTPGQQAASRRGDVHMHNTYNIGSGVSRTDVIQACAATQKSTLAQVTHLIRGGAYG